MNSKLENPSFCPECGAAWPEGCTCQDYFSQMLAWEYEDMQHRGQVHHLMVLCYHLQHPRLYAPDGLRNAQRLLLEFVEGGITPQEVRRRDREKVDSGKRSWKIKARPGLMASYCNPIRWPVTSADMIANGADVYNASIEAWARSVLEAMRASGNLSNP
jgi:hypothetical protein